MSPFYAVMFTLFFLLFGAACVYGLWDAARHRKAERLWLFGRGK